MFHSLVQISPRAILVFRSWHNLLLNARKPANFFRADPCNIARESLSAPE